MTEPRPVNAAEKVGSLAEATLAARRLEDAADVLLISAYGLSLLALALGAGPALVAPGLAFEWRLLSALGGLLVAAVTFVLLKYASEATRALADLARTAARVERRLEAQVPPPPPPPAPAVPPA